MKCVEASFIPQIKWRLSKCYKSSQRGAGREGVADRARHLGLGVQGEGGARDCRAAASTHRLGRRETACGSHQVLIHIALPQPST